MAALVLDRQGRQRHGGDQAGRGQTPGAAPRPPTVGEDRFLTMARRSYYPHRSGDVFVVTRPHWFVSTRPTGTNHGTPHEYDTHVPLMVYGPGVRPLVCKDRVSPLATAAILSHLLDIEPPLGAEVTLPECLRSKEK